MTTKTINNYGDVFTYVFDTMDVVDDMPEFWWEQPLTDVRESVYWQGRAWDDYKHDNDLTDENEEEVTQSDAYAEYEDEYFSDIILDNYVIYKVTGDNLDKLPEFIPVYWVDDLESYVFLQGWYGMASYLLKVDPFKWEVKD